MVNGLRAAMRPASLVVELDDERLVANARLVLTSTLSERLGLEPWIDAWSPLPQRVRHSFRTSGPDWLPRPYYCRENEAARPARFPRPGRARGRGCEGHPVHRRRRVRRALDHDRTRAGRAHGHALLPHE